MAAALIACFAIGRVASGTEVVARSGDPALDIPGRYYTQFFPLAWTNGGALLFYASTYGLEAGDRPSGIYRWTKEDGLALLLAGGVDGSPFLQFAAVAANRAGDVLFDETLPAQDPPCILHLIPPDTLRKRDAAGDVAALWSPGEPLPSGPAGLIPWSNGEPLISDSGRVVVGIGFADPACASVGASGFFGTDDAGVLSLIALLGDPAIGVPDATLDSITLGDSASLDDAGRVVFEAELKKGADQRASAIYRWDPNEGLALLDLGPWRTIAPGSLVADPTGVRYAPAITADGGAVFIGIESVDSGNLYEPEHSALYEVDGAGVRVRWVGPGDPLPGASDATITNVIGFGSIPTDGIGGSTPANRVARDGSGDTAVIVRLDQPAAPNGELAVLEVDADGHATTRVRGSELPQERGMAPHSIGLDGYRADGAMLLAAGYIFAVFDSASDEFLLERGAPPVRRAPFGGTPIVDAALSRAAWTEYDPTTYVTSLVVADVPEPGTIAASVAALLALAAMRRRGAAA